METYVTENITFNQMFDEKPLSIQEYLNNIEKESLLRIICHIVGINSIDSHSFKCRNFLKFFFQDFPTDRTVIKLHEKLNILEQSYEKYVNLTFINPAATLDFLKECVLIPNTGTSKGSSLNDLMNIFKAYLTYTTKRKEKLRKLLFNIQNDNLRDAKLSVAEGLQDYALTEYNINDVQTTQLVKCFAFNNFMQKNYYLKDIQNDFLNKYNFSSIYEFIMTAILPLKIYQPSKFKEGFIALEKKDFEKKAGSLWQYLFPFCNNISIDVTDIENSKKKLSDYKDYTCFKQYPLLKINDDTFFVISPYFYALKLYDSLRWDIKQIYENKKKILCIKQDYTTYITTEFSEHILLYKTIEQLLGHNKYFTLPGKIFSNKNITGRPDYYIRTHNQVFLFEFKDMLINKDKKDSDNVEDFINHLKEKLDREKNDPIKNNLKHKNKGIPQIVNNINDIFSDQFESDKNLKLNSIKIYPILIIDNRLVSINGINYILNEWFKKRIQNNESLNKREKQIMPLLVIDYDFLIILTFALKQQFGTFISLYHSYQNYLKRNNDISKYPSFRNFILNNHKISISSNQKAHAVIRAIIK